METSYSIPTPKSSCSFDEYTFVCEYNSSDAWALIWHKVSHNEEPRVRSDDHEQT